MNEIEFIKSIRDQCNTFLNSQSVTPTTITDDVIISTPQTIVNQIFEGAVIVTAPDVTFDNCKFPSQRNEIILSTYHRTKVNNCILTGNDNGGQHKGIFTNYSNGVRITNSKILNIWKDIDTCAVGAYDGCKDLIVDNCDLEASGENVLFGGATLSSPGEVCESITISNSRIFKNLEWKKKLRGETCKNLFEVKCGRNIIFRNNELKYSWVDGQDGYAFLITLRQDPSPWSVIENLSIMNNKISDVAACFNILGKDSTSNNPDDPTISNIRIIGNEFTDVDCDAYGNGDPSRVFIILRGSKDLQIISNSVKGKRFNSAFYFGGEHHLQNTGLIIRDNLLPAGEYGIFGDDIASLGKEVLDVYAPNYKWLNNTITDKDHNPYVTWPNGTK